MKAPESHDKEIPSATFLCFPVLSCAFLCFPLLAFGQTKLEGTTVKSDEWIIRRDKGEEEFRGRVSLTQPDTAVETDWALFDKNRQSWLLRGNVHGKTTLKNQELIELWAHELSHEIEGRKSRAQGRPEKPLRFKYVSTQTVTGEALQADLDEEAGLVTLQKKVRLKGETFRTRSETARITAQDKVVLTGGPPVLHSSENTWEAEIRAEEIEFDRKNKGLKTKNRTKGWIHWSSKPKI